MALLLFGGFFGIVPWFLGAGLLWGDPRWGLGEKLAGTNARPLGYAAPLLLLTSPPQEVAAWVIVTFCVAPLAMAALLVTRVGPTGKAHPGTRPPPPRS